MVKLMKFTMYVNICKVFRMGAPTTVSPVMMLIMSGSYAWYATNQPTRHQELEQVIGWLKVMARAMSAFQRRNPWMS